MTTSKTGAPAPMLAAELAQYIHEHIPLTKLMGVSVVSVEEHALILQAPLAPNVNHRHTVFGGSASALAILAGWALLHVRLRSAGLADHLVIQRNTMEYEHPIAGQFTARATLEHPDRWSSFTTMIARKGKARIGVLAALEHMGRVVARFNGEFVALDAAVRTGSAGA
jgi:thioesterase domain-containing protein